MQQRTPRSLQPLFVFLFLFPLTASSLTAQSSVYEYGNQDYFRLELNKPLFDGADDVGFFNLANYLNAQFSVSNNVALTAEVPFAFSRFDGEGSTGIGNIHVGANYYSDNGQFKAALSVGIPSADDSEASSIGFLGDPTERLLQFNQDLVPIKFFANVMDRPEEGFEYRIRGGFELLLPTDDFQDTDLLFGLSALAGFSFDGGIVQGGLSTVSILTEEDLDFSERVIETITLTGEFDLDGVRPGVVVRIPLDEDLADLYNLSVGVSVAVLLDGE